MNFNTLSREAPMSRTLVEQLIALAAWRVLWYGGGVCSTHLDDLEDAEQDACREVAGWVRNPYVGEGRAAVFTATFERGDEDAEMAQSQGRTGEAQLAAELQEACDAGILNGVFKVKEVES
jgi:hypothetical protein